MISGYLLGSTTMATLAWFLADALTIAGPPMSIWSMAASPVAPAVIASTNGYRFTTTN